MPSLSIFVQDSVHRHPQSTALSPHTLYVVMDLLLEIQVIPDPRGGDGSENNTDNMLHGEVAPDRPKYWQAVKWFSV